MSLASREANEWAEKRRRQVERARAIREERQARSKVSSTASGGVVSARGTNPLRQEYAGPAHDPYDSPVRRPGSASSNRGDGVPPRHGSRPTSASSHYSPTPPYGTDAQDDGDEEIARLSGAGRGKNPLRSAAGFGARPPQGPSQISTSTSSNSSSVSNSSNSSSSFSSSAPRRAPSPSNHPITVVRNLRSNGSGLGLPQPATDDDNGYRQGPVSPDLLGSVFDLDDRSAKRVLLQLAHSPCCASLASALERAVESAKRSQVQRQNSDPPEQQPGRNAVHPPGSNIGRAPRHTGSSSSAAQARPEKKRSAGRKEWDFSGPDEEEEDPQQELERYHEEQIGQLEMIRQASSEALVGRPNGGRARQSKPSAAAKSQPSSHSAHTAHSGHSSNSGRAPSPPIRTAHTEQYLDEWESPVSPEQQVQQQQANPNPNPNREMGSQRQSSQKGSQVKKQGGRGQPPPLPARKPNGSGAGSNNNANNNSNSNYGNNGTRPISPPIRAGNGNSNNNSNSNYGGNDNMSFDEMPIGGGGGPSFPPDAGPVSLAPCSVCGRKFNAERLAKHEDACRKANTKKRRVFDPTKHRTEGTEMAAYVAKAGRKPAAKTHAEKPVGKKSNWRQQHEQFVANIRAAREYTKAVKSGADPKSLPPPAPSEPDPTLVGCQYCGRRFAKETAERHIPKCKNTINRPKPPPGGGSARRKR